MDSGTPFAGAIIEEGSSTMEMLGLLILMLSFYWLILGCAEVAKYFNHGHRQH